ncbi:predicted protein [Nematostella vectensis]|uniref:Ubiquitin-like protein 7 n=1 Tax=Nematostella vectensis TaxID=45351 RepID=A7RS97_NEMVE|nr:predicted protein [Nematostella vectensis]|eukprot:XP_001637832.1 predicted protein [Nematostella vectensis]
MPFICIREARKRGKHRLEGIGLDLKVGELKEKTSEVVSIPANEQNIIYGGQVLRDENSLEMCGVKEGCTVYILRKLTEQEPIEQDKENTSVSNVMQVLEAAIKSPTYRNTIEQILGDPVMLEQLISATPGLSDDPVALTLLQDRELLQQVIETADIDRVVRQHPSLVQAASYIAAAAANDDTSPGRGVVANDLDEEMRDMDPGLIAQAEMVAAHEERIQASQATRAQVTPSMLALALASAGLPSSNDSPSGAGPSGTSPSTGGTSSSSSRTNRVTRNLFSQAMSSAMSGSSAAGSSSTELTETQLQGQLQQLRDMGITDQEASLRALRASGGDVQSALDLLFGGT